jgi:hypothetical protein
MCEALVASLTDPSSKVFVGTGCEVTPASHEPTLYTPGRTAVGWPHFRYSDNYLEVVLCQWKSCTLGVGFSDTSQRQVVSRQAKDSYSDTSIILYQGQPILYLN